MAKLIMEDACKTLVDAVNEVLCDASIFSDRRVSS